MITVTLQRSRAALEGFAARLGVGADDPPVTDAAALGEAYRDLLAEIAAREPSLAALSEAALDEHAAGLLPRGREGERHGDLLTECFAVTRELARRELGERPYDVQLLAGLALADGKLAEMQTGEGKTLAAVPAVALAALAGRGVHVLTTNDYLARRDASWMGPIYRRLGLRACHIEEGLDRDARRHAYAADVTYLTVKEAGFDHLRDTLCLEPRDVVQRPFHHALVDEADSILIDEARIPLVIAGDVAAAAPGLPRLAKIARSLVRGTDFGTDETGRNVFLTEAGVHRVEQSLGCGNLFAERNIPLQAKVRNALHAEALLARDVDYIVRQGRVELVDELTGRVADDRHWPDGLQAAIEAKEELVPQPEGRILGTITIQQLLQSYPRLSGMTATALAARHELASVYGLEIAQVPTHRPCTRLDHGDRLFWDRGSKNAALLAEITEAHRSNRPVLVGTGSVGESERLSTELARAGIPHRLLNAKHDAIEAEIVADAGALGAVTISTNMAGRGTDIRLGGADEAERDAVAERGGRLGDPGSSRFFVSLEDELMVEHGIEQLLPRRLLGEHRERAALGEPSPREALEVPAVHDEVARLQRIIEGEHADLRRRLLGTWRLLEEQRQTLLAWRRVVLFGETFDGLLAERAGQRWAALCGSHGEPLLTSIEQRITLLMIDRGWSDHLADMQGIRDEVHLVQLDGRDPLAEFSRTARAAFVEAVERIEQSIVETFERVTVTAAGVDWEREGLLGPSSTWTYLVNDNVFGSNTFLTLANRASFGVWAVLLTWPLLLAWGIASHWRRWRERRHARLATESDCYPPQHEKARAGTSPITPRSSPR